jgi:hypothetical protein
MNGVVLTPAEMTSAALVGVMRQICAIRDGRADRHGFDGSKLGPWEIHIEGALGECAAAKLLKTYWGATINTFKSGGDVGRMQVKTRSVDDYDLIVRNDDRDGDTFVLVTGRAPSYHVRGWILGRDAKQDRYLKRYGGRPPAWFVPQSDLRPIIDLAVRDVA